MSSLQQPVDFSTRKDNFLDLILTSHPGFKLRCKPLPAIGNSGTISSCMIPSFSVSVQNHLKENKYLWKRANVEAIQEDVRDFSLTHQKEITDISSSWEQLKNMLHSSTEENVPCFRRKQRSHGKARTTRKKRDNKHYKRLQHEIQFQLKTVHQDYMEDFVSENFKSNSQF